MPSNNPNATKNLKPFKKGQSGNPKGKPVGTRNFSTMVKAVLDDEDKLNMLIRDKKFKDSNTWLAKSGDKTGAYAIITAAMVQALKGDIRAIAWLKDQGWGAEIETESPEERKIVITTFATKGDL